MLPVVASFDQTARRIVGYTLVLWAISVAFWPPGHMGVVYLAAAVGLGGMFVWPAIRLARSHAPEGP